MNRPPLTFTHLGLIWVAILSITLAVGCVTGPITEHRVEAFTLVVADRGDVQKAYERYTNRKTQQVSGFYDPMTRMMWVTRGYGGRPDLTILGHELWHLPELGKEWHE